MRKKDIAICASIIVCAVLFLGLNLGSLSYLKGDENYYFQVGRRMIRDADFITPRYHHHIRFEKPPFYYWLVALFFKLFGVNWLTARAVSVIFSIGILILLYLFALQFFDRKTALLSVLILLTNELFFRYSRLCVSDITFLFLITSALYLFIKSYRNKSSVLFALSFIPTALAVLTKGPVGAIIVILTMVTFLIYVRGRASNINAGSIFCGMVFFLGITLPWVIAMTKIHGDVFTQHVWSVEILNKTLVGAVSGKAALEAVWHYVRKFGYYIPVVIFSFLPWGLFLPFAVFSKKSGANIEGRRFILSWFWVVFILFSIAGFKHTHYMLALSPALAMMVAVYLVKASKRRGYIKKLTGVVGVVAVLFFLSMTCFMLPHLDDGALRSFSLKIASEIEKDDLVGMASRQFNIKKLGMHLNNLVFTPHELSGDDLAQYLHVNKQENMVPLLRGEKRVFILITKPHYNKYVPDKLKSEVHILEKHKVWKKLKPDTALLQPILSGRLDQLKEDAYLISNRR